VGIAFGLRLRALEVGMFSPYAYYGNDIYKERSNIVSMAYLCRTASEAARFAKLRNDLSTPDSRGFGAACLLEYAVRLPGR
jgi:hypothetical protein